MSILTRPLTYADLERERESHDERLELIEGEIVVSPSPSGMHQVVALRLASLLHHGVMERGLGAVFLAPFDVAFDEFSVVQPDLLVLLRSHRERFTGERIKGAPSLVIEILSPSTRRYDRDIKRDFYARHGVPEYWLVNPGERTVTVFSTIGQGRYEREETTSDTARSATIPDFTVDLTELFAPIWRDE
jgi:Uma2 family endonuclease